MRNIPKENLVSYYKMNTGLNDLISCLKDKKIELENFQATSDLKKAWKPIKEGQYIEVTNILVELKLIRDRAHYHQKFMRIN